MKAKTKRLFITNVNTNFSHVCKLTKQRHILVQDHKFVLMSPYGDLGYQPIGSICISKFVHSRFRISANQIILRKGPFINYDRGGGGFLIFFKAYGIDDARKIQAEGGGIAI